MSSGDSAILIDAGLSARETARRLSLVGADLSSVRGICISHEHNDHAAGLRILHQKHSIPLYSNGGTMEALVRQDDRLGTVPWQIFHNGVPFQIGDITVEPFSVPHDAYDPVGFVLRTGEAKIGVVTDMGMATELVRERLRGCRMLIVEANHDVQLLKEADRPWSLKQRILGRQGHLSNETAAAMLVEIAGPELQHVFLAHISRDCNRHELALRESVTALARAGLEHIKVSLTYADRISEVWHS